MPANAFNGYTNYGIGLGLRVPHYLHILEHKPVCDWFEIISENFMVDGGRPLEVLDGILEQYRVVQHGVSMYFGSAEKLNREHLTKLKRLVKRTNTPWLSDHLCWGSVDGRYTHDLLPMPYTRAVAKHTARKIRETRDFLEVPIAVENVSSYAEFHASDMTEWEFLSEVVELADCGILLDVNNIYVSSMNHSFDPFDYLNNVPAHRVAQIHIAGHSKFEKYILDTHDHAVIDPVWKLYARAIQLAGPTATLLEWDAHIPSFEEVHHEALKANKFIQRLQPASSRHSSSVGSVRDLLHLQRQVAGVIMKPLTADGSMQPASRAVTEEFIKPNERLTSVERLELYNRQYWFRLSECFYDDYPGLRAIIGEKKFAALTTAYLTKNPSSSFTLRNLGQYLERFLIKEPQWIRPHQAMAFDMARFEWARVVAFDGEAKAVITADDLLDSRPDNLRLGLQPYLSLLALRYPLDEFLLAVKQLNTEALRGEASNAVTKTHHKKNRTLRRPAAQKVYIAVHRVDNAVYYKRLAEEQFEVLNALQRGLTLAKACAGVSAASGQDIQQWFATWMRFGWFCKR